MISFEIDPSIKVRKPEDMFFDVPTIVYVNKFTEESAKQFFVDMVKAEQGSFSVIPVVIDSYGGSIDALLSMVDTVRRSKKTVATVAMGKAMSCGSILLTCGAEGHRYISPHSRVMIHEASSTSMGKVEELKADAAELTRLNETIFRLMARNCGHYDEYFSDLVHQKNHADWFLTADEAVSHRIANFARVPQLKVQVSLSAQFQ